MSDGTLTSESKRSIDVVIPAFNEELCVSELCRRLTLVFDALPAIQFRAIIVDNGSTDSTLELLKVARASDQRFHFVELSRNFGSDNGISAGLAMASSDAVVIMNADLQDPPELIPLLVAKWIEGFDNIYGIVVARHGTKFIRRVNSVLYYRVVRAFSEIPPPINASDFRLLDRQVYETLRSFPENSLFLRSLISWMGFKSVGVQFERPPRFAGESKADTRGVVRNAVNSILQSSTLPLKIIPWTGTIMLLFAFGLNIAFAVKWFTKGVPFSGFGTIVSILLFGFGMTLLLMGLLAKYLWLTFEEARRRPRFLLRTSSLDLRSKDD